MPGVSKPGKRPARVGRDSQRELWGKISLLSAVGAACRRQPLGEPVLKEALRIARKVISCDAATLFMLDRDSGRLEEVAVTGGEVAPLDFLSLGKGEGLAGWTADHAKPVLLSRRSSKRTFDPQSEYGTFLAVPLVAPDGVIGVLNLGCIRENAFGENDLSLATLVADHLALTLERWRFEKETKDLEKALLEARRTGDQARKDLAGLEKLEGIDELAARINHEINDPLAVILGNVQCLLVEKMAANQKAQSRLKRIESAAVKIGQVNEELVNIYSRLSQVHSANPSPATV